MKARGPVVLGLLLLSSAASLTTTPSRGQTGAKPWRPKGADTAVANPMTTPASGTPSRPPAVQQSPGRTDYLPDSVVLVRVDERASTVGDFIDSYFNAWPEDRPNPDSAGRVQFLENMVNRDVLALVARKAGIPLTFEDRATMREHTQRVLSNVLFLRAVLDSVRATEEEIRQAYELLKYQVRARHILFRDMVTAERVRLDLVGKRITWENAHQRYSISKLDKGPAGDLGWLVRPSFDPGVGGEVFSLKPQEISPPFVDKEGIQLVQVTERRPAPIPSMEALRPRLEEAARRPKIAKRGEALLSQIRSEIGMTYDTTNIAWACRFFSPPVATESGSITINEVLPEFTPQDTARILARHRDGVFTLGMFLGAYSQLPPVTRSPVQTPPLFQSAVDNFALEPYRATIAVKRGLDKDPVAVKLIERKRDGLLVEHLYRDSISNRVSVDPAERRKYYSEHQSRYVMAPLIRYASLLGYDRADAESLAARLRGGEGAEKIIVADSLLGKNRGAIYQRYQTETGKPYHKLLFEELRPGQTSIQGPDKRGEFVVLQLISYDPGRQMSFEESEHYISESLQNMAEERLLKQFLERHRREFRIESHPELVMRIRLVERDTF